MAYVNWPYMMRRQSTAAWTADTVALLEGEPGWDLDTGELAIGDGTTLWSSLDKFIPGSTTLTSLGVSAFMQTVLDDADAATARGTLGAAPLASPALTGTPTAPTAPDATNNTQIATTAFVQSLIANLINSAPGALDTLGELATLLEDTEDGLAALITTVSGKLAKASNLSDLTDPSEALDNLGASSIGKEVFRVVTPAGRRHIRLETDGSITLLTAAELLSDIGAQASGSYLIAGNNLSDVTNASTARSNLGLGSIATLNEVEASAGSGQSTSSATPVDLTGITATLDANGRYAVDLYVVAESANTSTGIGITLNGSTGATYFAGRFEGHQSSGNFVAANITAYDGGTAAGTVASANTPYMYMVSALIVNGASSSTLSGRIFRGGSSNTITVRAARMKVRKLA